MGEVEGKSFQFGAQDDKRKSDLIKIMIVAHRDFCIFSRFVAQFCVLSSVCLYGTLPYFTSK